VRVLFRRPFTLSTGERPPEDITSRSDRNIPFTCKHLQNRNPGWYVTCEIRCQTRRLTMPTQQGTVDNLYCSFESFGEQEIVIDGQEFLSFDLLNPRLAGLGVGAKVLYDRTHGPTVLSVKPHILSTVETVQVIEVVTPAKEPWQRHPRVHTGAQAA